MNEDNQIIGPGQEVNTINTNDVKIIDDDQSNIENTVVKEEVKEANTEYEKSLKGFYDYITSQDTKELIMVFIRMLIIVTIIFLFKYPFDLIKEMGLSIFDMCGVDVTDLIYKIWDCGIELIYYVLALITFVSVITKRYDNLIKKKIDRV